MTNVCARGCTYRSRHLPDCDDRDACRGCLPRKAEYGELCYPCHKRLDEMLKHAPEQCHLLRVSAGMAKAAPTRGDADLIRGTGELRTPLQLACVDAETLVSDILAELVEELVRNYQMRGPERMQANVDRDTPGRLKQSWSPSMGEFLWTEPPARFHVDTAAPWLRAQIERLEYVDGIGDTWETLAEAMSQAHALAPWRPEMTRMPKVPCPHCQRTALALFGGDENVTCTSCGSSFTPGRYSMWARMYEADQVKREGA